MKKMLAITVLLCFAAVFLLTILMIALHTECVCTEKLCAVCPKLFKKREMPGQMMALIVIFAVCTGLFTAPDSDLIQIKTSNIVKTNIRMNN